MIQFDAVRAAPAAPGDPLHDLAEWVGHPLRESQRLVIHVMNAGVEERAPRTTDDELPAWSDVYEGLSEAEIDELDAAIVRAHSSRDVA